MPSGGFGDDENTVAASGASLGNVRRPATLEKSAELQTTLASPDDKDFGTKIFENIGLSDLTPAPVTRVGDLLRLCSYFMSHLGPSYLWMIKVSMIEWLTLSTQVKKLHAAMRRSFVTSYAFGAEAILQHWLWKTLKNATQSFGPLLQVFPACRSLYHSQAYCERL
jgi:hypothetical protein